MKKTIKAALTGITTAAAGFLKKRGIYVVALALISAAALSAVLTIKQPNEADPAQTADPASEVNTDIGDRLNDAQLPIATPTPAPTATPTPMPDFTPAPPTPKPTAAQNNFIAARAERHRDVIHFPLPPSAFHRGNTRKRRQAAASHNGRKL